MEWCPSQDVSLPHTHCFHTKFWIDRDPDQDKVVTEVDNESTTKVTVRFFLNDHFSHSYDLKWWMLANACTKTNFQG